MMILEEDAEHVSAWLFSKESWLLKRSNDLG